MEKHFQVFPFIFKLWNKTVKPYNHITFLNRIAKNIAGTSKKQCQSQLQECDLSSKVVYCVCACNHMSEGFVANSKAEEQKGICC